MTVLKVTAAARLTGHNASIFALSPGRSSQEFFSGAGEGWIAAWDLEQPQDGKLEAQVQQQIFSLAFEEKSGQIIAGDMNGGVHFINPGQPEGSRSIRHHQKGVFAIKAVQGWAFTGGGLGKITKWDPATARPLESLQLTGQSIRAITVSPDQKIMAVGCSDNNIYLIEPASMQVLARQEQAHDNSVFALCFSIDGQTLFSGGRDAHLKAWAIAGPSISPLADIPAHWFTINSLALHPQGLWLASASRDKTIKIWDPGSLALLKVLEAGRDSGHINSVNSLFWSSCHGQLISASDDRSIIVWQVEGR